MSISSDRLMQVLDAAECLYDAAEVSNAYDRLAQEITATVGDRMPLVLCVLTGGLIPTGQLTTRLDFPLQLDYLHATRYQGGTEGKELSWVVTPSVSMKNRSVLIVDDILDEGVTMDAIINYCRQQKAKDVYSAVLVEKHHGRRPDHIRATFTGLQVDDRYVFGCGMDYHGYMRNLPEIYAVNN